MRKRQRVLGAILFNVILAASSIAMADAGSRAIVQEDGTLRVDGKTVHLYGIYIPPISRTCRTFLRPVQCGPRAVLQLDFKIQGFVYCDRVYRHRGGSISAVCRTGRDREDLAAWLL